MTERCEWRSSRTGRRCPNRAALLIGGKCNGCGSGSAFASCGSCYARNLADLSGTACSDCPAIGAVQLSEPVELRAVAS